MATAVLEMSANFSILKILVVKCLVIIPFAHQGILNYVDTFKPMTTASSMTLAPIHTSLLKINF